MPAEADTGGHWVLHCDSRADCPTATPVRVPISSERRRSSAETEYGRRRVLRNRRRRAKRREVCATEASDKDSDFHLDDDPAGLLGDEEEKNDFLAKIRSYRRQRRDGLTCLVSKSQRAAENALGSFPATWGSREGEIVRAKSRLRDEPERVWLAERRSLRDRSRTRRRTVSRGRKRRATDHSKRTNVADSLLSSPHSRVRSQEEPGEDDSREFLGERSNNDSTVNARLSDTEERDERPEGEKIGRRDDQDEDGKRIGRACHVRSILRLVLLLFLITFGRCGPRGPSSVLEFSARSAASGLSVLGIGAIVGAVSARPVDLTGDAATRAERSANLSHITGASRKIQMFIKHRYLQILPDGTVNGSSNDHTSDYTVFQRISVSRGQMKIQGVATCLYLCMDSCGLLYGSREYTEDCVFNETLEEHNYNTYSSVRWSTSKKTLYLGLNRFGQPRKVSANGHNLGRLSAYARVLTQIAPADLVEALQRRMMDAQHNVRHRHNGHGRHRHNGGDLAHQSLCPSLPKQEKDGRDKFRCRKRKKRKKRKRRCRPGERPGPQCQAAEESIVPGVSSETTGVVDASVVMSNASSSSMPESKRSCEGAASEEACRRQALSVPAKKRKMRIDGGGGNLTLNGKNKAPTSNAKKPNVSVADSQSKKPDLTDGKKKKRKGAPGQERSSGRGSAMIPPSRKRHESGTTSSFGASSPRTALASEERRASTATSSSYSSPSPPGASTALSSVRKPSLPPSSGRKKPLPSSRNHVARPAGGTRRVGMSFPGSPGRPRLSATVTPMTLRSETAHSPTITKVPESVHATATLPSLTQSSPFPPLTFFTSDESIENSSLSDSSAVDEDSSSAATSEPTTETAELSTSAVLDETTYRSDEEGSGMADAKDLAAKFPLERLAM